MLSDKERILIYRVCDRPKYMTHTFPHLLKNTSENTGIVVVENSKLKENTDAYAGILNTYDDPERMTFLSFGKRIGVNEALREGIEHAGKEAKKLKHILIVDDDILCPEVNEGRYWDDILVDVMEGNDWWVTAFKVGGDYVNPKNLIDYKGYKLLPKDHVSGGGATGIIYDRYRRNPFPPNSDIFTFGKWMAHRCRDHCTYVEVEGMRSTSIDNARHPLSLRDTEYSDYSDDIFYHRHPSAKGKPRPKGA